MTEFSLETAKELADRLILETTGKHLSDLEAVILQESWHDRTYARIADKYHLSPDYLQKDIGNKLWRKLSGALGEEVSKTNFKEALRRKWKTIETPRSENVPDVQESVLSFPGGLVPLESPFYIERRGVEESARSEVLRAGSLVRIKAPHFMGKTSLMLRLLAFVEEREHRSVYIDLQEIEQQKISNLEHFLRWICLKTTRKLGLENRLQEYWDTDILGSNDNCTAYFEEYILPSIGCPLLLGLDNVDRVFPYSETIDDFFGMLRSWHEKGKTLPIWQNCKLALAHSTEVYITLDLDQSPFNAGLPIELTEFDFSRTLEWVRRHQLEIEPRRIEDLVKTIGGHPYLLHLALYYLKKEALSLDTLLAGAATESGIYRDHLRGLQASLKSVPHLSEAYKKVVTAREAIELDSLQIYKLHSMGLVRRLENRVIPRCELYRQYFQRVL